MEMVKSPDMTLIYCAGLTSEFIILVHCSREIFRRYYLNHMYCSTDKRSTLIVSPLRYKLRHSGS